MNETNEIPRGDWSSYLDEVTTRLGDAEISIEVAGAARPTSVAARELALQFLAYLPDEGLFEVAGETLARRPRDTYHHLVDDPRRIVVSGATTAPRRIEVDGGDGSCTVITFD